MLIKDLSEYLLSTSDSKAVCRQLHTLASTCTIFAPLQVDLFQEQHMVSSLEYLATAIVKVSPLTCNRLNDPAEAALEVIWKKSAGALAKERAKFVIDQHGKAVDFQLISAAESRSMLPQTDTATPFASFNLGLTEQQKRVKDSLILPYTRLTLEDAPASIAPVLAPDFDDEDPDEDLEI